jgi:signal transduction histidine kinase/GAF domain-containing protein
MIPLHERAGDGQWKSKLSEFIVAHRAAILEVWEREARSEVPPATGLVRPALIDALPHVLEDIAEAVRTYGEQASRTDLMQAIADEHAWERIEQGFALADAVRDLALLRASIAQVRRERSPGAPPEDAEVLARVVERAIEQFVARYVERRSQLLAGIEQIADAAFNLEHIDDFLHGLLRIFMRFAPSMDSAAILLREGDQLAVRAAIGLGALAEERPTVRIGEGFVGRIAATRKPLLLHRAWEDALVQTPFIRDRKTLALYGVPLLLRDEVVGVAQIGSRLSENIDEPEMRLFAALAQRATSAIIKHQLRGRVTRATAELRGVLEAIPSAVFVGDHRRLEIANSTGLKVLGFSDETTMAQASLPELTLRLQTGDPETGGPLPFEGTPFACALRGESVVREMTHVIGGEPRIVRGHAGPIRVEGETVGAAIVLTDVTEIHRVLRDAQRAGEFRERFIGIVSHDLRSPLNAIALSAGVLLKSPDLAPALSRPAGRILANVERMSKMISDLLDLTRGRLGGGIPITPMPVDLVPIAKNVVEESEQTHATRRFELECHGDTRGDWDGDRLAQVLSNLVSNALQHGDPASPVRVAVDGRTNDVTLTVRNSGPAIPPEALPHIFDPFRRASDKGPHSGLGLGLFIASEAVRAHGGHIGVTSNERGTTFLVTLPRRPA